MQRYYTMKRFLLYFFSCLLSTTSLLAQEPIVEQTVQQSLPNCNGILSQRMSFLVDGSFQSEEVPRKEITKLKGCGIDDFDINFFGNMNAITSMLTRMTKKTEIHRLTYSDLLNEINNVKESPFYMKVRNINDLSETLANRVGSFKNWPEDEKLFDQLGSSSNIKGKVLSYLRENPENKKTYKEILEALKK